MRHLINYSLIVMTMVFMILFSYGRLSSTIAKTSWEQVSVFLHDYSIRDSFQQHRENDSDLGYQEEEKEDHSIS